MLFDPNDKEAVAFVKRAAALEDKFEIAVERHLLKRDGKVTAGSTTFTLPTSFDEPIVLKRFLNRPVPLRSSMNVKIAISDGRSEIHRDVPLIRMLHAVNEAERLHATLLALPKEPLRHLSTNPVIQLIDRHIASYIAPDLAEIAKPLTGTWLATDVISVEPEQSDGWDAVAAMERTRVHRIHEISEMLGFRLFPWAPYETFMCGRPMKFGCFAEPTSPDPFTEFSIAEPGNLRRLESCGLVLKLLDGEPLSLEAIEAAMHAKDPAPIGMRIASARFLTLLQTLAGRNGGYGANLADIRLALDLAPDAQMTAAVFGLWQAMLRQFRKDELEAGDPACETHSAPDGLQ